MKPLRRICGQIDTLLAASVAELVPNVMGFLFFEAYQQRREWDPDEWATQVLHIIFHFSYISVCVCACMHVYKIIYHI